MAYVSSRKLGLSAQAEPNIIRRNSTSEHTYKRLVAIFPELKDVEPPNMGSTLPRGRWKKSKKSDADLPPSGERNLLGILLRIRAGKASHLGVCELLKRIEDGDVSSTSVRELLEGNVVGTS